RSCLDEGARFAAAVSGVAVDDQDQLAPAGRFQQPAQEVDEHLLAEAAGEDAEPELAAVADGLDDVTAEAAAGLADQRRLPLRGVAAAAGVVGAQPHLVAPENQRPLAFGAGAQTRILLLEPARDRGRVALVGALDRLLRPEAPAAQVVADRPD